MSLLYPRLLPGETEHRFQMLHKVPVGEHHTLVANHSVRAVYAATGGRRATREELDRLRQTLLATAQEHGFPRPPSAIQRSAFDLAAARVLHEETLMVPGEAAQRQVWAFLALVLLPDVCVWRWPAAGDGRYVADRFKGTDLTRHALARLWTRAHVLRDSEAEDPYLLLNVLGEADLDQIMARRSALASSPALVRTIVRVHREDSTLEQSEGLPSRQVLRETLMRLLRLTAFLDLDSYSEPELKELICRARSEAQAAMAR